ncbi:MAG: SIMPL domain-containing protein [Gammaproteobacteria bacterium]|nr:SIMPL domain-containing protein [Gammaproteobacteria bacterium]
MQNTSKHSAFILGLFLFLGLTLLGYLLAKAAIDVKQFERSVTVKGLSERDYNADIVIWPIQFTLAENNIQTLYKELDDATLKIKTFLINKGVAAEEISLSVPNIIDKSAQQYGNGQQAPFRFTATQTVTVYSSNIETVRPIMTTLSELGKQGIVLAGNDYQAQTEYLFTQLNDVKPVMIEQATTKAREVAEKFASDSQSKLGKIKRASQGQFSISNRDKNNPHIKKIRVVSTVEYYLSD